MGDYSLTNSSVRPTKNEALNKKGIGKKQAQRETRRKRMPRAMATEQVVLDGYPYRFDVPGPPVGYYAEGKHPNWTRQTKYTDYKKHVQACAAAAGIPRGSLVATKERPLIIHTWAYFRNGVHPDPGNVQKGICDALFYGSRRSKGTSDKYTGGSFPPPRYDADNPRVEVIIELVEKA